MLYSELLPSPYISNVDVCEMDWNEMERKKKNLRLISVFHCLLPIHFHLPPSLSLFLEINDKMSIIWNCVFPLPSMTVKVWVTITTTEMSKLNQWQRESGVTSHVETVFLIEGSHLKEFCKICLCVIWRVKTPAWLMMCHLRLLCIIMSRYTTPISQLHHAWVLKKCSFSRCTHSGYYTATT